MNKAFVREPDDDGRAFCPRCGNLGAPVNSGPLDTHIRPESRAKMLDAAWFCGFYRCDVAYFNLFGGVVLMDELKAPVYPYDANAPICACFGLKYEDVEADVNDGTPTRICAGRATSAVPPPSARNMICASSTVRVRMPT